MTLERGDLCSLCGDYRPVRDELQMRHVGNLHHLRRSHDFDDFAAALGFAVEVGTVADREWHHPDLTVSWGHVEVVIYTHKIDGLHRSDFVLAAKMDARYGG